MGRACVYKCMKETQQVPDRSQMPPQTERKAKRAGVECRYRQHLKNSSSTLLQTQLVIGTQQLCQRTAQQRGHQGPSPVHPVV